MCGRFTQACTWSEVYAALSLLSPSPSNMRPRYNVAPTTAIDVVVDRGAGRELVKMIWGLAPAWAKPSVAVAEPVLRFTAARLLSTPVRSEIG
jgi:putative SOS response-associated peptidase YedK